MKDGATKIYNMWDVIAVLSSLVLAGLIVAVWMQQSPGEDPDFVAFRLFSGFIALGAIFMAMCFYGIVRFVPKGRRTVVTGLVALPALYGGLVVGGLRSGSHTEYELPMGGSVRVQDGLAALWWGKQAATELPVWTRGGMELWPTASGDFVVQTTRDQVNVVLLSEATSRECERLVGDMSEQQPALTSMEGWLSVNGKRTATARDPMQICQNGGMITISSPLTE